MANSHEQTKAAQQEPVAWPCVIAEADFEQDTITLEMKCTNYKVGAGEHWLTTSLPQAREPLTDEPYAYTWESRRLDGSTTRHIVYADHYVDSPGDLAYVLKGHDYIELFKRPHAPEPQEPDQRFINLLCRIHRDGGHYIAEHGFDKAVAAADIKVAELNSMSDTRHQAREPLTDEQIQTIAFEAVKDNWDWLRFARAIEAAIAKAQGETK